MPGYVYRGTIFDADIPLAPPLPRKPRAAIAECGTPGGISRHRRAKEKICPLCAESARVYKIEWRARVKAKKASA